MINAKFYLLFFSVVFASCGLRETGDDQSFTKIGQLKPRSANEIKSSPISIGGETLDRDYADYHQYKEYLGPLGAKKIRLQAGWAKTEKKKGVYDWKWLDDIIDDALAQGVAPWLQTSYGNPIYEGGGGKNLGAGLPTSPEALDAWDNWVREMAIRYKDKVEIWEIWNEGDVGKNSDSEGYINIFIRSAEIIRSEIPGARIYALSLARPYNTEFTRLFLEALQKEGKLYLVDEITFHGYVKNPSVAYEKLKPLKTLVDQFDPRIKLHQGEQGSPSTFITSGALRNYPWTEASQAKWALRRLLGDLGNGYQTLYFTMVDLYYGHGPDTHIKDLNTKGLLASNEKLQVLHAKPSYYAVQNLCAVMDSSFLSLGSPDFEVNVDSSYSVYGFQQQETGHQMVSIWIDQSVPADTSTHVPVNLKLSGITINEPLMVDLLDGNVFSIPEKKIERKNGTITFLDLPIYDSPVLLAESAIIPTDRSLED